MDGWSAPDARGVQTRTLDVGARATLKGRRLRRNFTRSDGAAATWPSEWTALARDWLAQGATMRWATLLKRAGPARVATAQELLQALLDAGWIALSERREPGGRWVPVQITVPALEACREALGLPNRDHLASDWHTAQAQTFGRAVLTEALHTLQGHAPSLALRRHGWLTSLDQWCDQQRSGTRRDFAYFATGLTKGIPDADWRWLAECLDLGALGIDAHTPLLLIHSPQTLIFPHGRLSLGTTPDFHGLTPATLAAARAVAKPVAHYRIIENQTSFEHACRSAAPDEAVIWVPGRPPRWWCDMVGRLLRLSPAPAVIEADPDPYGIAIACEAGALWAAQTLPWCTHNMEAQALDRLPRTQALTELDRQQLDSLLRTPLPATLRDLALAMQARGLKGEQEGLRSRSVADTRA
tara:strand:- start:7026 stop:8261 length:1236 start_codon:yes stop_codon:yes gene_type:complete